MGDRVLPQQLLMNVRMNSIDAIWDLEGMRELAIKSQRGKRWSGTNLCQRDWGGPATTAVGQDL
jgi:hypothetical protein